MDSEKNNQVVEDAFGRAQEGSAEDAANKILNMWESPEDEQPTDEEVPTAEDEEVVEDEEEEDEVETEEDSEEEQTEEEVEEDAWRREDRMAIASRPPIIPTCSADTCSAMVLNGSCVSDQKWCTRRIVSPVNV